MAVGVCLLVVLQPVSGVVSEKWVLFSAALQLVSRSRRCSRSIPKRSNLGDDDGHVFTLTLHVDRWS